MLDEQFPDGEYVDVVGLCRNASIEEIEAQGWSLNPGRYVGTAVEMMPPGESRVKLGSLVKEFEALSEEADQLTGDVRRTLPSLLPVRDDG